MSPGVRASPKAAVQALCPHTGPRIRTQQPMAPMLLHTRAGSKGAHPHQVLPAPATILPSPLCSQDPRYRSKRHSHQTPRRVGGEQPQQGHTSSSVRASAGASAANAGGQRSPQQGSRWWATQSCSTAWSWWAARTLRPPQISQHSLCVRGQCNVKGHQALKRRAAHGLLKKFWKKVQRKGCKSGCGNNACFLFSQHHCSRPTPAHGSAFATASATTLLMEEQGGEM